jgi:hypothetical protein
MTAPVVQANYEQLADIARRFKAQAEWKRVGAGSILLMDSKKDKL